MSLSSLINGMNMGKIGDFVFYIDKNAYKKISQTITATHGSFKPIKGQEVLSDSGGYEVKLTLNGVLVVQPLNALKKLEQYAKDREPLRFTTLQNDMEVVITSINTVKEQFTDNGSQTVTTYNLSLKEVFNDIQ